MKDVEMIEDNEDIADNAQDLIKQVQKQGIIVKDRKKGEPVELKSGHEAYFALLADDMIKLSVKYSKDVHDVHKLFYEVSCNRERLVSVLEEKESKCKWSQLEDLALKGPIDSASFQCVARLKGEKEVDERLRFLGLKQQ